MDSFTIKYEIDDLCDDNNSTNAIENDQEEKLLNEKNTCICFRLAKLFSDLLTKENLIKNGKANLKSRDSSSSSCASIRSSNTIPFSSVENNLKSVQSEFTFINKELKLIRKGQNEMLEKYDLIFKRMSSKLFLSRKNYKTHANFAQKHSVKRFASKTDLNDCNSSKNNSHKQTLVGAKKRKFNCATLNLKSICFLFIFQNINRNI